MMMNSNTFRNTKLSTEREDSAIEPYMPNKSGLDQPIREISAEKDLSSNEAVGFQERLQNIKEDLKCYYYCFLFSVIARDYFK